MWRKKIEKMFHRAAEQEELQQLEQYIDGLRSGQQRCLAEIYQTLISRNKECVQPAAAEIAQYMRTLNNSAILSLHREFRAYTSMEWRISWEKVSLVDLSARIENTENYLWVLRLGTFHPNGYFRERCMRALAGRSNSLPYLLLCVNDWVSNIRAAAIELIEKADETPAEEYLAALPYLFRVEKCRRREDRVFFSLEQLFAQKLEGIQELCFEQYEVSVRRYLYQLFMERQMLSKEEAIRILNREKNSQCKSLMIIQLLKHYSCTMEDLDQLLFNKNGLVRQRALEQKYILIGGYWQGAEKLLMDKARGVREYAAFILRKHTDIDIVAYYENRLCADEKQVCILGIGENGKKEDASKIQKYLSDTDMRVVKKALWAVSMLLKEDGADIYWEFLFCRQCAISKTAYRAIVTNNIGYCYGAERIYTAFVQCNTKSIKRYLAELLVREPSWERLPYVLRLYQYEDLDLQEIIRKGIAHRNVYAKLSKKQAEEIRAILNAPEYGIPQELQREIAFDLEHIAIV